MQGNSKIWYNGVKSRVKERDREMPSAKEIQAKAAGTNNIQRVEHVIVVELDIWELKEKNRGHIHPNDLRMTRVCKVG